MKFKSFIFVSLIPFLLYAQGSILLMGGGSDTKRWAYDVFEWFVQQADSGIVINIDVDPVAESYASTFIRWGADSNSHSLRIPTKSVANDSATYRDLISAKGIFIEGGNQWDYVYVWKGTLVEDALHYVYNHGGVIGGTSAGCAIMGEVVYDARYQSAQPNSVSQNPYDRDVQYTDDFLNVLPNVFTDSHFHPRARLGRLAPMVARRIQDYGDTDLMAIGVDENTALCINPDKSAICFGEGCATIFHQTEQSVIRCEQGKAPTFTHIKYHQLIHGAIFDIATRELIDPGPNMQHVEISPAQPVFAPAELIGSDESTANSGEVVITNLTSDAANAWYGRLAQTAGDSIVPNSVIIPNVWKNTDYSENRLIGGMYGAASHPGHVAIYLDWGSIATISGDGVLSVKKLAYILETQDITHVGFNKKVSSNYPGLINATLHFLGDGDSYNLLEPYIPVNEEKGQSDFPRKFRLFDNYPNPFNGSTHFTFEVHAAGQVDIKIYNILGQHLETIFNENKSPGMHVVQWDAGTYETGVYVYQVSYNNHSRFGKCILLR